MSEQRVEEPGWITSACPSCGTVAEREPYDMGSGQELSCADCEWCWGADGQRLKPLPFAAPDRILIAYAGGDAGLFSSIFGSWMTGDMGSLPVTRSVEPWR